MKKLITLILAASLLTGCGSNTSNGEEQQTEQSVKNEEQQNTNAFAAEADSNINSEEPPEFLSDENKKLFERAEYITFFTLVSTGFDSTVDESRLTTDFEGSDGSLYAYETDYMYSDFEDYISSVFTGEALEKVKNDLGSYFETSDGKLCWVDAARGTNIFYVDKTFEPVSETDDKIEFKAIANYSGEAVYGSEEAFNESGDGGEYAWSEEYNFEMVKTDDGWRVSRFEYWK